MFLLVLRGTDVEDYRVTRKFPGLVGDVKMENAVVIEDVVVINLTHSSSKVFVCFLNNLN